MLDTLINNSTFSAPWAAPGECNTSLNGEAKCYRTSFEIIPIRGEHAVVFKGKAYCSKEMCPRSVVVKATKRYTGTSDDCDMYILCNEQARQMTLKFNRLLCKTTFRTTTIRMVVPTEAVVDERASLTKLHKKFEKDEAVIIEEKLKGTFTNFISKTGEAHTNHIKAVDVLEAFCHFTYQESRGTVVLCGLKGICNTYMTDFYLTNPTIHSTHGKFGRKDKRDAGIYDFQCNHRCNAVCRNVLKLNAI